MTNKQLKIAFVSLPESLFDGKGVVKSGSVIVNEQLIEYFRSRGHEVIEFSPSDKRVELRKITGFGNSLMFQGLLQKIDQINSCDILISTNYFGVILPEINIPQITIFHHCAKTLQSYIDGEAVITDKSNLKKWLNIASRYQLTYKNNESLHDKIVAILEQYAVENSVVTVAVSEAIKKEISTNYGSAATKISVAYNSIPASWLQQKADKKFDLDNLKLLCVTRMPGSANGFMMKGIDRVFEVMSQKLHYQKTIIASTNKEEYLKLAHDKLKDTKLILNLDHHKVGQAFAEGNVSIHCSRVESFGLTLVESMLMGNIVIVYAVGVAPEIIEHGKNGFIVKNVAEMIKILKAIPKMKNLPEISDKARETVIQKMSPEAFGARYEEILYKAIEENKNAKN